MTEKIQNLPAMRLTYRNDSLAFVTMDNNMVKRIAAGVGVLAAAATVVVGCAEAKDAARDVASSASSVASSAVEAGGSAASSAASAAGTAASSAASAASSAVSSVVAAATDINVPGVGDVKLEGATAEAYSKLGGEARLGLPTAQPEKVGDGTVQAFANGTIFATPATGAHLVQGEILRVYQEHGGATGALGFPTADEVQTGGGPKAKGGGWIGEFQNGTITWLNQGDGTFTGSVTPKQ